MNAQRRWIGRIGTGIVAILIAGTAAGCAARAEYVYDEPVVYRRGRVYRAPPPPPVIVHEHPRRVERHYHYVQPRVYRAPANRRHHHHPDRDRDRDRDDDRREHHRH